MTFSINSLMIDDVAPIYYTPKFFNMLETHMVLLRQSIRTYTIDIVPADRVKYDGDLYGLLLEYGIPLKYHYIVMRLNELNSPQGYNPDIESLLAPDPTTIESLRNVLATIYNVM
jgi:hypothetical protein